MKKIIFTLLILSGCSSLVLVKDCKKVEGEPIEGIQICKKL